MTRASATARRHGFRLHAGVTQALTEATPAARYRTALRAADKALLQGALWLASETQITHSSAELRELRSELGKSLGERPKLLLPRFERYMEAVLAYTGYRIETTRSQLEAGLERLIEPLLATGYLDKKSFNELHGTIERGAEEARTLSELLDLYRHVVSNLEAAVQSPVVARQERSTTRAQSFMQDHLSEPLTLEQVARVAGFAPDYFSRLLRRERGMTFERYLQSLRVERAKHMLVGTPLSIEGVRNLTGFHSRSYFHRVFKKSVGLTPAEYRTRMS